MFCTQCGSKNAPESKFCTNCGNPLVSVPVQPDAGQARISDDFSVDSTAVETPASQLAPQSAEQPEEQSAAQHEERPAEQLASQPADAIPPVPLPGGGTLPVAQPATSAASQSVPSAPETLEPESDGTARAASPNRKLIIGIAVAAVLLVAAVVAGIVTYNMELWGGKSLPDVAVASPKDSSKTPDAKVVVRQLEGKGLKVKRVKEFSGVKSGKFLGYQGIQSGGRIRAGSVVTVRESAGPGVPEGTVGKKTESVVTTFSQMGVPVHYKQVIVSDTSKTTEGSVISTYPAQGQGVKDGKKGIYIGVATKSDGGLPSDIVGQEISDVKSSLESKGYDVKVEKRLSSKQYIGKVSGSEPGPGSQLNEGQTITLYQGVDAKGAKQTFIDHSGTGGDGLLMGTSDVASGQWCNKAGDCITLGQDDSYSSGDIVFLKVKDGAANTKYSMTGESLISCDAVQQPYCSSKKADYLLTGNSGAFELFPHKEFETYWCGDSALGGEGDMRSCVAGKVHDIDSDSSDASDYEPDGSGKFHMMDLFAVFPVGSDVESVEKTGYFDASALAAAQKQKPVDTDRPFLMYRDVNQYKDGEKESTYTRDWFDPFMPYNGYNGSKDDTVKMKPAPSDETAYYLVEDVQPDWDSLEDANIKGVSAKSQKSNGKNASKNANTKKSDSQSDAATRSLMKSIAGKYGFASGSGGWGTTMTVASDGTFSGTYHDSDMGITGDDYPNGSVTISNFKGRFKDAKKNADGSYAMQCDKSALKIDGNIGDTYIKNGSKYTVADPYGIAPCGTFTVYPAGYDSSQLSEAIVGWSHAWYDSMPAKLETPIIVNAEDTNLGSESQQDAFFQSKYLE